MANEREEVLEVRPKPHHLLAGSIALLLSLVLHTVLWNKFPGLPIPLGRAPQEKQYHPIHLEEVRLAPPPRPDKTMQDDRIRPENPKALAELLGAPAPMPELATDAILVPAPPDIRAPVNTQTPSLGGPVTAPDRTRWEPRQEILQVEKPIVKDEVALLPRQFAPAVPRVQRAPDVVMPIELPMGGTGAPATPQAGAGASAGYSLSSPRGVEGGRGAGSGEPAGAAAMTAPGTSSADRLFPGPTDLFTEKPADVSATKPVEKYLDLTMYLYRSAEEGGAGYFELQISRHGAETLPVLPKDVLFIQDCSESITPSKLAECKEGLRRWLNTLGPQDRFEIISFRDSVTPCFNGWRPVSEASLAQGLAFIEGMRSIGNTDVYASLEAARRMRNDDARPVVGVLVTDGRPTAGVIGSSDIIEGFTRQNRGAVPIFALGAGKKVNRFLLDLLSYRNRGESTYIPDESGLPDGLARQAGELGRPVLYDLNYNLTGYDAAQIYPQSLTHLFLDRPLVIYGRIAPGEEKAVIQLLGRAGGQQLDMVFPLEAAKARPGESIIRDRWAWQKVYGLIGTYIQTQNPAILEGIRAHARQYGLVVPYGYGEGVPAN